MIGCGKKAPKKSGTHGNSRKSPARRLDRATRSRRPGSRSKPSRRGLSTRSCRSSGSLSYDENKVVEVGPRIGGRVSRILADFGQQVRAGQVLAEIDSPELGQALARLAKEPQRLQRPPERLRAGEEASRGKGDLAGRVPVPRRGIPRRQGGDGERGQPPPPLRPLAFGSRQVSLAAGEVSSTFPAPSPDRRQGHRSADQSGRGRRGGQAALHGRRHPKSLAARAALRKGPCPRASRPVGRGLDRRVSRNESSRAGSTTSETRSRPPRERSAPGRSSRIRTES